MLSKNVNLIFIGGFFPVSFTAEIALKSKRQIQNAANEFQHSFINGLMQNVSEPVKLVSAPFIGWYPRYYKDLIIKTSHFSGPGALKSGVMVGFLNLPLIKNYFKYINLKKYINKYIAQRRNNVLIVYSLEPVYMKAALRVQKKNPGTLICVIITDLPEISHLPDFQNDTSLIFQLYRNYIEKPEIYTLLRKIDCFVVLTDSMVDFLHLEQKPWVRVEGIYDGEGGARIGQWAKDRKEKIVLYTGSLNFIYGIRELLDAFNLIKQDHYRLWICGGGSGAELVMSRAREDKRIQYFGMVSKQKVIELQSEATILVNPRNTIGEYNKYSFPSKTIEYLASGTPALLYKLDGIPDEYFHHCFTVEDNSPESLAAAIQKACELDPEELISKGQAAREFILQYKTAKLQCAKVLNMIENMVLTCQI